MGIKASPPYIKGPRAKPIELYNYSDEVIRLEQAGYTVKSIYHYIQKNRYEGTYSAFRTTGRLQLLHSPEEN